MGQLDDILYRLLRLEEQLESYKRLHAEEQQAMARSLEGLRREMLTILSQEHGDLVGVSVRPDLNPGDDEVVEPD